MPIFVNFVAVLAEIANVSSPFMSANRFYEIIAGHEDDDLRAIQLPGLDYGPKPLVSVWVSTYNQEKYIRQCLDGVLMQKVNFAYEIIIGDDCSTDSNQKIIREYAEQYPDIIRPILGKKNLYSADGRSRVLEQFLPLARGKYMTMCEGDDYWIFHGRMQALADFLESHPKHSLVFHAYDILSEIPDIEVNAARQTRSRTVSIFEVLIVPHIQYATCMGRLNVLKSDSELQKQYLQHKEVFFDMRQYISWFNAGKIYYINKIWSVYRVQAQGLWTQIRLKDKSEEHDLASLKALETFYSGKYHGLVKKRREFIDMQDNLNAWTYSRRKHNYSKAVIHLLMAFFKHPVLFIQIYFHRYVY